MPDGVRDQNGVTVPDDYRDAAAYLPIVRSLQRSNLWFSSMLLEWEHETERQYERTALKLMRMLASNSRAVVALGEQSIDNVPAALMVSRSCFETGLTCSWLLEPAQDEGTVWRRWLGLQKASSQLMKNVKEEARDIGFDSAADRWGDAQARRDDMRRRAAEHLHLEDPTPISRPSVPILCKQVGYSRLYYGYRLSSQFTHGTLMAAEEFDGNPERGYTRGPWANDWLLPLSMTVWGLVLAADAFQGRMRGSGGEPVISRGPIQDTIAAIDWYSDL